MTNQIIKAKTADSDRVVRVNYDFGDSLKDAIARFGEESVFSGFKASAVIDIQALIRRHLKTKQGEKPITDEQLQAIVSTWKPRDKTRTKKSASDKVTDLLESVSEEERLAILEKLTL